MSETLGRAFQGLGFTISARAIIWLLLRFYCSPNQPSLAEKGVTSAKIAVQNSWYGNHAGPSDQFEKFEAS